MFFCFIFVVFVVVVFYEIGKKNEILGLQGLAYPIPCADWFICYFLGFGHRPGPVNFLILARTTSRMSEIWQKNEEILDGRNCFFVVCFYMFFQYGFDVFSCLCFFCF